MPEDKDDTDEDAKEGISLLPLLAESDGTKRFRMKRINLCFLPGSQNSNRVH
jgi:hypothetical protein